MIAAHQRAAALVPTTEFHPPSSASYGGNAAAVRRGVELRRRRDVYRRALVAASERESRAHLPARDGRTRRCIRCPGTEARAAEQPALTVPSFQTTSEYCPAAFFERGPSHGDDVGRTTPGSSDRSELRGLRRCIRVARGGEREDTRIVVERWVVVASLGTAPAVALRLPRPPPSPRRSSSRRGRPWSAPPRPRCCRSGHAALTMSMSRPVSPDQPAQSVDVEPFEWVVPSSPTRAKRELPPAGAAPGPSTRARRQLCDSILPTVRVDVRHAVNGAVWLNQGYNLSARLCGVGDLIGGEHVLGRHAPGDRLRPPPPPIAYTPGRPPRQRDGPLPASRPRRRRARARRSSASGGARARAHVFESPTEAVEMA